MWLNDNNVPPHPNPNFHPNSYPNPNPFPNPKMYAFLMGCQWSVSPTLEHFLFKASLHTATWQWFPSSMKISSSTAMGQTSLWVCKNQIKEFEREKQEGNKFASLKLVRTKFVDENSARIYKRMKIISAKNIIPACRHKLDFYFCKKLEMPWENLFQN